MSPHLGVKEMLRLRLVAAALALGAAWPAAAQTSNEMSNETGSAFVPVTDKMLQNPAPGDWLNWRRTPNGWAFSPLDEINRRSVAKLTQDWTYALAARPPRATPHHR